MLTMEAKETYRNPYEEEIKKTLDNPELQNTKLRTLIPHKKYKNTGYPPEHRQAIFNYVEEQIVIYGRSLRSVLKDDCVCDVTTLLGWVNQSETLRQRYAGALRARADFWADEILRIAYDSNLDYTIDSAGKIQVDGEAVQRSRLKIDALKWLMAKVHPHKYGDKVNHEITGADGGTVRIEQINYSELPDDVLRALLKATNKPSEIGGSE